MSEKEIYEEEKKNGKKLNITITLMIFLIVQLCSAVWWAAGSEREISHNKESVRELKSELLRELKEIRGDIRDLRVEVISIKK